LLRASLFALCTVVLPLLVAGAALGPCLCYGAGREKVWAVAV
jgi:hypothetical protein